MIHRMSTRPANIFHSRVRDIPKTMLRHNRVRSRLQCHLYHRRTRPVHSLEQGVEYHAHGARDVYQHDSTLLHYLCSQHHHGHLDHRAPRQSPAGHEPPQERTRRLVHHLWRRHPGHHYVDCASTEHLCVYPLHGAFSRCYSSTCLSLLLLGTINERPASPPKLGYLNTSLS